MTTVQRIDVLSFAKLHALVAGCVGIIAGTLYSFGGLIIDAFVSLGWIVSDETPGLSYGTVLAFGALVGMPLIFAVCGFVAGATVAVLYNCIARWTGGLEIHFK